MPTSCFHTAGGSGGFGPGRSAIDDCESAREGKQLRTTAAIEALIRTKRESTGTPGFLFSGPAFNEVTADMIAESGRGGDLNRAAGGDFDGRIDDVLFPIAFVSGNIAGESVTGQGRDRDVVRPTDTTLQHATTPRGYVAREA